MATMAGAGRRLLKAEAVVIPAKRADVPAGKLMKCNFCKFQIFEFEN